MSKEIVFPKEFNPKETVKIGKTKDFTATISTGLRKEPMENIWLFLAYLAERNKKQIMITPIAIIGQGNDAQDVIDCFFKSVNCN